MKSDEKKEPIEILKDKFRSIFGSKDPGGKKNSLPPKAHFSLWYFVAAFLIFSYLQQNFFSGNVETIPYSQFKQYIFEDTLIKLTIGPENITGTMKGKREGPGQDQEFTTVRVNDPDLVKVLDDLAHLLSQKESVQGEELRKMLAEFKIGKAA